jgi:hypothetical protein
MNWESSSPANAEMAVRPPDIIAKARPDVNRRFGWGLPQGPSRHPPTPYLFLGIRRVLLDAISHALIRLRNPKQKLFGTIVYRPICFGAGFPS